MKYLFIILSTCLLYSCAPNMALYKSGKVEHIDTLKEYYYVIYSLYDKKQLEYYPKVINYTVGDSVSIKQICSPERCYLKIRKIEK